LAGHASACPPAPRSALSTRQPDTLRRIADTANWPGIIQWVKYPARGFRNKQNFINAIYFPWRGLDLAPAAIK
jgi:hypothetical protein